MNPCAIFILDTNELRAAGYATLLMPLASRSDAELHVALRLADFQNLSNCECLACLYCVGGRSLTDEEVAGTIAGLREIFAHLPVIVLSDLSGPEEIAAATQAGLRGFLPTTMPTHVAMAAIQFILAGGTYVPHATQASPRPEAAAPAAARVSHAGFPRLVHSPAQPWGPAPEPQAGQSEKQAPEETASTAPLRQRHVEVLNSLSKGHPNKVIARQLNLTEATVKLYVRQLMKIFHAENRTQLALQAANHPQVRKLAASG